MMLSLPGIYAGGRVVAVAPFTVHSLEAFYPTNPSLPTQPGHFYILSILR